MLSSTTPKPECLVVPLDLNTKPYKANLSRTDKTQNCLVYNLELLKSKQQAFKAYHLLNWPKMLARHLSTNTKLITKTMNDFGIGAFTLNKVSNGEFVIYPGQLVDSTTTVNLPVQERIYYLQVPNTELCIDPKYTDCIAKYFQHLPRRDANLVIDLDDEMAEENFGTEMGFVEIYVESETYIVPVRVLKARRDVEAGSIVGFDYGKKYWQLLKKVFTCFTKEGVPIKSYCFDINEYKYIVGEAAFSRLLNEGFSINKQRLLFLPNDVRRTLQQSRLNDYNGTQALIVQALGEFNLNTCEIIYDITANDKQPDAVLIKLPADITLVHSKPIFARFADNINYPIPAPIQAFSIQLLLTASLQDLAKLHNDLNKITHSRFKFRIVEEKQPELFEEDSKRADPKEMIDSLLDQWIFRKERVKKIVPLIQRTPSPKL